MDDQSPLENDELSEYDIYGKTPPRTKILRKNRERKQKEKQTGGAMLPAKSGRPKTPLFRRNTVSTMIDDVFTRNDSEENDQVQKQMSKRQMKLLRGSERDLKLDIASAQAVTTERNENQQEEYEYPKTPGYQIESNKRFMSLMCRTLPCKQKNGAPRSVSTSYFCEENDLEFKNDECSNSRLEFYQTLKALIRMGNADNPTQDRNPRKQLSREETLWQNELKDVIWLELQAYHADRTPMEEDAFLCSARELVEPLLNDLKNYKFQRQSRKYLSQNSDSGIEDCDGCLSLCCISCLETQNDALRDVEKLLQRLEDVKGLFPSSKAFAELYPLYSSPEIVGRVKAMCLWYNMTKHHRLKLNILGRIFTSLENEPMLWPMLGDDNSTGSPSDSNSSTKSLDEFCMENLYDITPIVNLLNQKSSKFSPYRRYIENTLKTKDLSKSLMLVRTLHKHILTKARITLEKPEDESIFSKMYFYTEQEELRRYGAWCPEAKTLQLPSYRTEFIFLTLVPLQVINEYILMRLEQKPANPSPLSVQQLIRELREGMNLALCEKERAHQNIKSAIVGINDIIDTFSEHFVRFEEYILRLFKDYLDYLEQLVLLQSKKFQKTFLEDEYQFCCYVCTVVPKGRELMDSRFSFILSTLLKRSCDRLIKRIDELLDGIPECSESLIKQNLFSVCRELQCLFNEEQEISMKSIAFVKMHLRQNGGQILKLGKDLTNAIGAYKCIIPTAIEKVQSLFEHISLTSLEEFDKTALNTRIREILMQVYGFGFEIYKEVFSCVTPEIQDRLATRMISFANLWMKFVTERCERGRGLRPRWASQGMEFLLMVCEPLNTKCLSEDQFENLKKDMDVCISHVVGTIAPSTPDSGIYSVSPRTCSGRSRCSSPSTRPPYKSQRSNPRKISVEHQPPGGESADSVPVNNGSLKEDLCDFNSIKINYPPKTYSEQCQEAIEALDMELDNRLRKQNLIGKVLHEKTNKTFCRRFVAFSWQRGRKIGQGRFGKVYTAVNNDTGEMMAVKEIALQHNDSDTIKNMAAEMKILKGIVHRNLVRSYGMEVHKGQMLIFMEYCSEGTLEDLIVATETGLPELLGRRYTFQLLSGVACLHEQGIVHRDIKTANIFLTDKGNCLKIGDFGCAVKIKSANTMPGELQGFVGTQAYMAPEVFTRNMSAGHGRAADIWSVGCVVVEMASGQRPWAQYDSNYQIMFKVGMGQSPDPPDDMIDEGLDFLDLCFKHEPKERATAAELLHHNFVKVGEE